MQLFYLREKCQKLYYKSQARKSLTTSSSVFNIVLELLINAITQKYVVWTKCLSLLQIHIQIHSYPQ